MKQISLIDKAFILKKTPLFETLDLDLLLTISDKMDLLSFKEGEKIFSINQEAQKMYILVEGRVGIYNKAKELIAEVIPEDFFGEEAIFNERPRAYEACCLAESRLLSLSRTYLLSILSECPAVAISLLEIYAAHTDFRTRGSQK